MSVVPLLPGQPVTSRGDAGSVELIEIIQRLVQANIDLQNRVKALEEK